MDDLLRLEQSLAELANPDIARHSGRFFKTGRGEYGEGDEFLGIRVPELRKLVRRFPDLQLATIVDLLQSSFHEKRLLAALMLVNRYQKGDLIVQEDVYNCYLDHLGTAINNWDIIDTTCPHIIGAWLYERDRSILFTLSLSDNLWKRRASMLACFYFIRRNDFTDALRIAETLLRDREDLIHKATGWMLREIGKRDQETEERFLREHCTDMPRTMFRYAIERFDQQKRLQYLKAGQQ